MNRHDGQFDLLGAPPAIGREALFIGVFPKSGLDLLDHCARRATAHSSEYTLQQPARWHVTFFDLGEHSELRHDIARKAIAALDGHQAPPITATFDRMESFGGGRSLVLTGNDDGLAQLNAYRAILQKRLTFGGLKRVPSGFKGHITLAYGPPIEALLVEPILVTFDELVLIHSERGKTRYNVLGRWQLRG